MKSDKRLKVDTSTRVRWLAKDFAKEVKGTNLAFQIPDEIIEAVPDGYVSHFKTCLEMYGLVQRPDRLWEEKRL